MPVYHATAGLSQKFLRKTVTIALTELRPALNDPLPFDVRNGEGLLNIAQGLQGMHFPANFEEAETARRRFIFEELFFSQVMVYQRKARHRQQPTLTLKPGVDFTERFKAGLPFVLTPEQAEAIAVIGQDLGQTYPMHRLLQGDVGCGKTVVAAFALAAAAACGFQAALMAPTEVLARQHKDTLEKLLAGFGFKIALLMATMDKAATQAVWQGLKDGTIDIVVGTHALIQNEVEFKNLAVAVIDEQHKFGVAQRALLPQKGRPSPHCLVMSATPIPRSLALSLYGDLDLSVIKHLPQGRQATQNLYFESNQREQAYALLRTQLVRGRQAYLVYPAIEEGEGDLATLEESYAQVQAAFKEFKAGIFHGQLKPAEKIKIMEQFKSGKVDILMATTVIEVGLDVPNATVMLVEDPERFGLSQLHQLRGRIRRSNHVPYFVLLGKSNYAEKAQERLKAVLKSDDGFAIAESDLLLRGPGDFFGDSQHGLPALQLANPLKDIEALQAARRRAYEIVKVDPELDMPQYRSVREHLHHFFYDDQARA